MWIKFEVGRADPVANHAKFATSNLFEPRPDTDVFVSMVSSHLVRGRHNLAASTVYLMRASGMNVFQTLLISQTLARAAGHRIHFASNLFEVMLNALLWNREVQTEDGRRLWGRRTVTFFVHDRVSGLFAPSKYCAFVPVTSRTGVMKGHPAMDMKTYASIDESETQFDGAIARHHLTRLLAMSIRRLEDANEVCRSAFGHWRGERGAAVRVHQRGPYLIEAPGWWD